MKTLLTFFAAATLTMAATADTAATAPAKTSAATATTKAAAKPAYQPLTVPKEAVANGNGGFDYTDAAGKKWVYTNTPFGVTRAAATDSGVAGGGLSARATDLGDTVRFEQSTPFGSRSWTRKKAELTDDERRIVESQAAPNATPPSAASPNAAPQTQAAGQN